MELVVATVQSLIFTLDLCSMRVVKELKLPLDQGPPSCVYADRGRQWVAIGTSLGFLSVWDARFALPVRSWKASSGRIRFCLRHPLKSRWLLVAGESSDGSYLQSFEVETGRLVENFTTSTFPSSTSSAKPAGPSPSSGSTSTGNDVEQAMARILAGRAAQQSTPPLTPSNAVLAVAVQPRAHQSTSLRADGVVSGPTVFTSGISGRIRCLNFADLQRSKVLATHGSESKINYRYFDHALACFLPLLTLRCNLLQSCDGGACSVARDRHRSSDRVTAHGHRHVALHRQLSSVVHHLAPDRLSVWRHRSMEGLSNQSHPISYNLLYSLTRLNAYRTLRLLLAIHHLIKVGVLCDTAGGASTAATAEGGAADVDRIVPRRTLTYLTFLVMLSTTLRSWP